MPNRAADTPTMDPRTRRWRSTLTAAVGLAVAATLLTVTPGGAATSYTATTVTHKPTPVSINAPEIGNPGRGQYAWMGYDTQIAGWPIRDVYYRDQVYFGRLAPQPGVYDFRWIDDGLAAAEARGGKFSFRVMTYCPGCWMNTRPDFPKVYPDYLPRQAGTDRPAWNHETYLRHWENLMAALGKKYANDPRLGYIDVGGYGMWGEWHVEPGTPEITNAAATRVIGAVLKAFPRQHIIINAMMPRLTDLALKMSPRIGLRTDCLGEYNMYSALPTYAPTSAARQRWKTAPVVSEWCGTPGTDFIAGHKQVRDFHISHVSSGNHKTTYPNMTATQKAHYQAASKNAGYRYRLASMTLPRTIRSGQAFTLKHSWTNMGSAPTYQAWKVALTLHKADGTKVAGTILPTNLSGILPGTRGGSLKARFPAVKPGTYTLRLQVRDAHGYLAPMNLSQGGKLADGSYTIGAVRIGA